MVVVDYPRHFQGRISDQSTEALSVEVLAGRATAGRV